MTELKIPWRLLASRAQTVDSEYILQVLFKTIINTLVPSRKKKCHLLIEIKFTKHILLVTFLLHSEMHRPM